MIDYATTVASCVKVVDRQKRGEQAPHGWLVDSEGRDTTDPNTFFDGGGLLPFGGHKGYALMFAAEMLGRVFAGADDHADDRYAGPILRYQGVTILAMKADLFQPMADYSRQFSMIRQKIQSSPPAPGFDEVLVPGDLEERTRQIRHRNGIPIQDDTWEALCKTARSVDVKI